MGIGAHLTKTRFSARLRVSRFCVTAYMWHWRLRLGAYWKPGPEADSLGSSSRCAAAGSTAHRKGSSLQRSQQVKNLHSCSLLCDAACYH